MSVILSLLGIAVAAAGLAALGFGIPINEFSLGTTLIVTGTTALTGGLILIGLAAVVSELSRVTDALKTRVVARPATRTAEVPESMVPAGPGMAAPAVAAAGTARPPVATAAAARRPRPEAPARGAGSPQPLPGAVPTAVDVSTAAIERLHSTIPRTERTRVEPSVVAADEEVPLSPGEAAPHQPRPAGGEAAPLSPKITAEDRAGGAAVEALKASRLDFLFRAKPRPAAPAPESFDAVRPAAEPEPQPDQAQAQPGPAAAEAQDTPPETASAVEEPPSVAILKSGVIDGMAYTLYADGSIEAKLPQGTVRFGSIAELRAHIESNS